MNRTTQKALIEEIASWRAKNGTEDWADVWSAAEALGDKLGKKVSAEDLRDLMQKALNKEIITAEDIIENALHIPYLDGTYGDRYYTQRTIIDGIALQYEIRDDYVQGGDESDACDWSKPIVVPG